MNSLTGLDSETVINAYQDNQTKVNKFGNQYFDTNNTWGEKNPITNSFFNIVNNNSIALDVVGAFYLVWVYQLNKYPVINKAVSIAHFYGAYSWRDAPNQVEPEIIYVTFRIPF